MSTTPIAPPTPTTPASANENAPTPVAATSPPHSAQVALEPSIDAPTPIETIIQPDSSRNAVESTTPSGPAPSNSPETNDIEMSEAHPEISSTTAALPNTADSQIETEEQLQPPPPPQPQTAPSPAVSEPNPPTDPYTPLSDFPYNPSFEDALMSHVLTSSPLPSSSTISDFSSSLPTPLSVPPRSTEHTLHPLLPLPLTAPHGSPYGGPGPAPAQHSPASLAFVSSFLEAHSRIKTEAGLRKAVEREVEERVRVVRERMRAREAAVRRNAEVEREVVELEVERQMERKVFERMRKEVG